MFPMRSLARAALLAALGALAAAPAAAQSDILLRLRSGVPAGDRFRIDSAGGVVALGEIGIGIIPASGNASDYAVRMMWHPFKGAFRAGNPGFAGATTWDDGNVGFYSWAGGNQTTAGAFATFAFGDQVTVTGVDGAAFGASNTVSGTAGFSAGASNTCSGFTCVAIGYTNTASGQGSVALGYRATADANYSVALGHRASANGFTGVFVASDQSTTDSTEASANNQFMTRYAGGYRLYTNSAENLGAFMSANGTTWNAISDRNRKELFLPVDGEDVLARIRAMPVTTWRFIGETDPAERHIGPMAQDWHRAFGFGSDSTLINSGDFDGVNLAAIQALERRSAAQRREAESLRAQLGEAQAQNAALRQDVDALRAANAAMEARLRRLEAAAENP